MFWNRAVIHRKLQYALLMTILAATPAFAEQSFDSVAGSWSGSGSMKTSDGPPERVRCKIYYVPNNSSQYSKMYEHCASDAYKMNLIVTIDETASTLSG